MGGGQRPRRTPDSEDSSDLSKDVFFKVVCSYRSGNVCRDIFVGVRMPVLEQILQLYSSVERVKERSEKPTTFYLLN